MTNLPLELTAELLKGVIAITHIYKIEFDSRTFNYTDYDQPVFYGEWYKPFPIKFDIVNAGQKAETASIKLELANVEKTFSNLALIEGIINKPILISRCLLDRNLKVVGVPKIVFRGFTDQSDIDRRLAKIECYNELVRWKKQTPCRMHLPTCTWKLFKGIECQYAGDETTCDRSYARCKELNNTINFGGFRYLSELQTKELWWGRKQKSWVNLAQIRQSQGH